MRASRFILAGLAAAVLASFAEGAAIASPSRVVRTAAAKTYPADLLVYAQEWSLWPSRTRIPAGAIDVQLINRGKDSHDVHVRALNVHDQMVGPVLGKVAVTPSGGLSKAIWHLKPGHYELYCSMPGHLAMGMHSDITVVRS